MRTPSFFGAWRHPRTSSVAHVQARTRVQGDNLGLPFRELDVEHKRLVLDPDLRPLARALFLNERAVLVEYHPVPT